VTPVSRQRLTLTLAAADVPRAEALLTLAGAETISLRDAADDPVLEPEPSTTPLWPHVVIEALLARELDLEPLRDLLATAFPGAAVAVESFEESAWEPKLAQAVKARAIGERLWLAPADDRHAPGERLVVRINMGLAFGTGEHATTALCLEWLERHVAAGMTLLDYGCGSGILALAALTLGARLAYAVDNDHQALTATRANAALNGVTDRIFIGAPELLPPVTVDVLTANILAGTLVELAPALAKRVVPGGTLVLSGILEPQARLVAAAYAPYVTETAQTARDGWVCLTGRVRAG
jgi:ribosomal protein L11 methyltransferase